MSDHTLAALDDAIRAHAADEWDSSHVAHWILVASVLDQERDDTPIAVEGPAGQPGYVGVGLMHAALHPDSYTDGDDDD